LTSRTVVRYSHGGSQKGRSLRRARVRRNLSDLVIGVAVAVFLCSAVALRVLNDVPLALVGLPLGLVLLYVSRAVDPPVAARSLSRVSRVDGEEEIQPLPDFQAEDEPGNGHRTAA
jgi:hypothetical protein